MSEATLRALVSIVLSSAAVPKIRFSIAGYQIYSESFSRLKDAIRRGEIGISLDDKRLAEAQATAAYSPRSDTMYLHSSAVKSTAISQQTRASIIHECLHAILDMDYVQGLSPYQEETACALTSSIYVFHHFGKAHFKPDGYAMQLTRKITARPGLDVTHDALFDAMYQQVARIYAEDDPKYGSRPGIHNGLRKTL